MSLLKGTISRGEVIPISFSLPANADGHIDIELPPGAYDISFVTDGSVTIASGAPTLQMQSFADSKLSKLANYYLISPADATPLATVDVYDSVVLYYTVCMRVNIAHPTMVLYGIRLKYTLNGANASNYLAGFIQARRR